MAIRCPALITVLVVALLLSTGCQSAPSPTAPTQGETPASPASTVTPAPQPGPTATEPPPTGLVADVVSVDVGGQPGSYTLSVGIKSPDQGCEQYADWWEVLSTEGTLIYRRVLLHSHVTEQPFVRSGGPVEVQPGTIVWVRAHMHPGGYGGQAFSGSVEAGFAPAEPPPGFAEDLAEQPPRPDGCAF
jgi:hypothetical protein